MAERIADELGQKVSKEVGDVVGYQVRFTDEVGPTTLIKLMTDGILLAEMGADPLLRRYDTIIVDEAHERSLNIDFILGYLGRPSPRSASTSRSSSRRRPLIPSALPTTLRSRVGSSVPVIEVSGRAYPVEVRYRPLSADLAAPDTAAPGTRRPRLRMVHPFLGTALHPEPDPGEFATYGYGLGDDLDLEAALTHAVDELLG